MLGDGQWHAIAEALDRALEGVVGKRLQTSASVAHEMVMVSAPVPDGFVAHHAAADVKSLDHPDLLELLEDSVDARAGDSP